MTTTPERPDTSTAHSLLPAFGLPSDARLEPVTLGHINGSWCVSMPEGRAFLQWLNSHVFPQAEAIQDNLETVLDHLHGRVNGLALPTLRRARDGRRRVLDSSGLWRLFDWLPGRPEGAHFTRKEDIGAAGLALGTALSGLASLPVARLNPVLTHFHDLDTHLAAFDAARTEAGRSQLNAAAGLLAQIDADRTRRREAAPAATPSRPLHGDPKLTNFLFMPPAGATVALVDWDTAMAGPLAWDFGDFLRSAASSGAEDNPSTAQIDHACMHVGASSFLAGLGGHLASAERAALAAAPAHMSFMLAVRFLTDHLAGDRYFRLHRPNQNLDRAATQLALASDFDAGQKVLRKCIDNA